PATRRARASLPALYGERRDADDRLVSTQHQQIGENSDGPAPEPDLTRDEPVPPCRDGGEWNNRGLSGKWVPGGAQMPSAPCIGRHGASEGYDCPSREKEEGRHIAVADQMHQRPEADPSQEWMARDPDDPPRRLPDASFLA